MDEKEKAVLIAFMRMFAIGSIASRKLVLGNDGGIDEVSKTEADAMVDYAIKDCCGP